MLLILILILAAVVLGSFIALKVNERKFKASPSKELADKDSTLFAVTLISAAELVGILLLTVFLVYSNYETGKMIDQKIVLYQDWDEKVTELRDEKENLSYAKWVMYFGR